MAKQDAAALRAARKERIAKRNANKGPQSQQKPPTEYGAPRVAVKPATPKVPDTMTAQVLDPTKISKAASLSMQLFNAESNDPHWMICADGTPLAEIRLSDQEDPNAAKKIFTTEAYANGIMEAASKMELTEVLSGIKARSYVAAVAGSDAYKALNTQVSASADENLRKAKANLRGDFLNALSLVVQAQAKNFLSENDLKDSLFQKMRAAGFEGDRAVAIVEAAWQEKAEVYFEGCFKQAAKWMDLSPEAYAEMQEQITGMQHRTPRIERDASVPVASPSVPSESHNVPLTTYSSPGVPKEASSEKEQLRAAFGFRNRNLGHQLPNR